ncbi:site-specific integrase [Rhizobium mongolense]|uniref:site-specific integrase n=1 Tax=Rhizobium mongolense TaxID=57676 RepID=UPI002277826B|nr:site-specific integrase [Rhizobium mongolense]
MDRIYAFTDVEKHGIRNVLIMNWALRTGARVSEILSIRLRDLPWDPQQQTEMIEKDQWLIKLKKRKNHLEGGILYAPADLIWDTCNYIEKQRQEIVAARGEKAGDAIFPSQRGTPIVADSMTRICNKLFLAAQVKHP